MTFPNRNQAGSGHYARSLVAALHARDDVRTFTVSAPRGGGFAGTMRWLTRGAGNSLSANPPSLVHCPAFVTPWNLPVPFVISVLDLSTRRFPRDFPLEWRVYERMLLPRRARRAALVIAISEATRQDVIAEYDVLPERVLTIHPGIDQDFFLSEQPDGGPEPRRLLFPGAPLRRKNLDLVLRGMAEAPAGSALAQAALDISGASKEDFPHYTALIRSLGLWERVRWLGQLPREIVPRLMAAAAAVVYPSFYEGFGFPPLEAMAAGTPVIASNASCLPEVLGDAALLVDPKDRGAFIHAAEDLLTRPELRARLVETGRERARLFTWDRCAQCTVEAYQHVLQAAA
jgi:glycosyltransferase involved in cell wall biosynthesis